MMKYDEREQIAWDKFAAAAMQGLIPQYSQFTSADMVEHVAKLAAEYADAMMKEWSKR